MQDITAIVRYNRPIASKTFIMGLELEVESFEAEAGQFVMLRVSHSTDPLLRRPFSIARIEEDGLLFILYRVIGRGTALMSQWTAGTRTELLGPLGKGFEPTAQEGISIMVAGGIGLAPLIFLSHQMESSRKILLMGAKTADEIIPVDGLVSPGLEIEIATDDGTRGHHGVVTDLLESILSEVDVGKAMVYACGPGTMLKKVSSICSARGVRCQVSLETAMACGVGACLGCAVLGKKKDGKYYHVCKDGPVFDAEQIEWNG